MSTDNLFFNPDLDLRPHYLAQIASYPPESQHDADCSGPFFSIRSHEQIRRIDSIVKLLMSGLTGKHDAKLAAVYVLKAKGHDLVKIGYTSAKEIDRYRSITKNCNVVLSKKYITPPFKGAYRAEQILHRLLSQWGHDRLQCPCGARKNTEWFKVPFSGVVHVVRMVENWIRYQSPYGMESENRELDLNWKNALRQWRATQHTRMPSEWIDFFGLDADHMDGLELCADKATTAKSAGTRFGGISKILVSPSNHQLPPSVSSRRKRSPRLPKSTPSKTTDQNNEREGVTLLRGNGEESSTDTPDTLLRTAHHQLAYDNFQGYTQPVESDTEVDTIDEPMLGVLENLFQDIADPMVYDYTTNDMLLSAHPTVDSAHPMPPGAFPDTEDEAELPVEENVNHHTESKASLNLLSPWDYAVISPLTGRSRRVSMQFSTDLEKKGGKNERRRASSARELSRF